MMKKREWRKFSLVLGNLLGLESSPVALIQRRKPLVKSFDKKVRICRAILEAGRGEIIQISKQNNACFGAAWHLGFSKLKDHKVKHMVKKFVVKGEKLFSDYQAFDKMILQMGDIPDNSSSCFMLAPMQKSGFKPDLVIFICDAETACRLFTLSVFVDGIMPGIKIGGPTCRMAIMYPLLENEVNLSFYDYTARRMCGVPKDKLLVSIPYKKIPEIIKNIGRCSAGRAKIEYPQELR